MSRVSRLSPWCQVGTCELNQYLECHLGGRALPFDVGAIVAEESWHKHLLWMFLVGVGQDIGSLNDLGKVAEDVVEDENGSVCIIRSGDICLLLGRVRVDKGSH